jgi:uncharacterized protein YaaN involved in tellurite resistance
MKAATQKQVNQIVEAINTKLKLDPENESLEKLKKQIIKIAKHLVKEAHQVEKKIASREFKLLTKEVKRQSKESRILAARQLLGGQFMSDTLS